MCAPTDALDGELISGTQRGLRAAASCCACVIDVGVDRLDQREHVVRVHARDRDFGGDGPERARGPVGQRGADGGAHLDRSESIEMRPSGAIVIRD